MKRFLLLLVIASLALSACVDSGNRSRDRAATDSNLLVFDMEKSIDLDDADTFVLNSISDRVRFVPLETTAESVIPNGNFNFAATDNGFYISAGNNSKGVLHFDPDGSFVGPVVTIGRGPGELPLIVTWKLQELLNTINVVGVSNKMVVKSLNSGKSSEVLFKTNTSLTIVPLSDGSFVYTKNAGMGELQKDVPYLTFIDASGAVVRSVQYASPRNVDYDMLTYLMEKGPGGSPVFETYHIASSYKGGALFQDVFSDTLYYIADRNHMEPYVVMKRGVLSPNILNIFDDTRKFRQVFFSDMSETERYFLMKYIYNGQLFADIWDKSDGALLSRVGIPRESAGVLKFSAWYEFPDGKKDRVQIVYADKDRMYCLLEASVANRFLKDLNEDDNPVVMIVQMK